MERRTKRTQIEACFCSREAGEREKKKRAWDDGKKKERDNSHPFHAPHASLIIMSIPCRLRQDVRPGL